MGQYTALMCCVTERKNQESKRGLGALGQTIIVDKLPAEVEICRQRTYKK
jgi:hypothetical protein